MAKPAPVTTDKITRDDLEAKFRALQGDIQDSVEAKKPSILAVAGGVSLVVLVLFFFLGKRAGKKKSAVIEIRRV